MKISFRPLILAVTAVSTFSAFAVNWNATEDLDLANKNNWASDPTGQVAFFQLLKNAYPNGYTVTSTDNVRFGRTEAASGLNITFDIAPWTMVCQDGDSFRSLAVNNQTICWTSGTLCTSNTAGTARGTYSMQVNAKNIKFIVDGKDAVVRSNISVRDAYDSCVIITNGARVYGQVNIQGYSNNFVHITGKGTWVDYQNTTLAVATSRTGGTVNEYDNHFIIDDGAVVTNFSGISVGSFNGGYSELDADGLHMPMDTKLSFALGDAAQTKSCTIRLKNSSLHFNNARIGNQGTGHCLDLGTNTVVCNTGTDVSPIGMRASHCSLYLHDGAVYSNLVTQVQVGYQASVHSCALRLEKGSSFYGGKGVAVGYSNSTNNTLTLSGDSELKTGSLLIGTEGTDSTFRQHNEAWAFDSTLTLGGLTFAGYDNRLVLSNSTVSMSNGNVIYAQNYNGGQNRMEFYGQSQLLAKQINWGGNSRIKFQIPENGYPDGFVPIQTSSSFQMGDSLFEFDIAKYARNGGGTVTLATFPAYNFSPRGANATQIAQWAAITNALPKGCTLIRNDDAGTLKLKVKPDRGLMLIIR